MGLGKALMLLSLRQKKPFGVLGLILMVLTWVSSFKKRIPVARVTPGRLCHLGGL